MSISKNSVFDKGAADYDKSRRKLIPCFDDFYGTVVKIIPYEINDEFCVLDLGAGSGILSFLIGEKFPKSKVTLIDNSEKMLNIAQEKNNKYSNNRYSFIVQDFTQIQLECKYEVIVSALSIHHIDDISKKSLFKKIYTSLIDGGIFINADQVLGSTIEINAIYNNQWFIEIQKMGINDLDLLAAKERIKEDKMAKLDDQLKWLENAGFYKVNCWYKYFNFVVYSGTKKIN